MQSFRNKKEIPEMKDKIPILYVTSEAKVQFHEDCGG